MRLLAALAAAAAAFAASGQELPPPSPLEQRYAAPRFRLERVLFEGARSISEPDLQDAVKPWVGRLVGSEELHALTRAVDGLYEARGYVGSRARLDDQPIVAGTVRLRIEEQQVARVEVAGNAWNRDKFVEWAAWPPNGGTLHLPTLQERLAQMKESGLFERVAADVRLAEPGEGGATLRLDVAEANPLSVAVSSANNRSPAVGAIRSEVAVSDRSVLGWGDALVVRYGRTSGLDDSEIDYTVPIPLTPAALVLRRVRSDSLAIEPAVFKDLDIIALSDIDSVGATVSLLKSPSTSLVGSIVRERRRTETTLLGLPFSFTPGLPDEAVTVWLTRAWVDGAWRGERSSASGRLGYSSGRVSDVIEVADGSGVKARFGITHGAFGIVRRLDEAGDVRLRVEGQYASQVLPPVERLAIGGSTTVRGYRENLLLRDTGVIASAEWRLPEREWSPWARASAALFGDAGWGRSQAGRNDGLPASIASVGVALEATLWKHLKLSVALALPSHRNLTPRDDLQDRGVHWAAEVSFP